MVIHEMNTEECFQFLSRARLARLACARENQPYVVPVSVACHLFGGEACLYSFTTLGQKVEWMRANPLVCVEVDDITSDVEWVSVIAFGRYQELPDTPEPDVGRLPARAESPHGAHATPDTAACESERLLAHQLLSQAHAQWLQPAAASRSLGRDAPGGLAAHAQWLQPAAASRAHRDPAEPFIPIFYKVQINQVTGHRATRD
jgi:hypothetical protein